MCISSTTYHRDVLVVWWAWYLVVSSPSLFSSSNVFVLYLLVTNSLISAVCWYRSVWPWLGLWFEAVYVIPMAVHGVEEPQRYFVANFSSLPHQCLHDACVPRGMNVERRDGQRRQLRNHCRIVYYPRVVIETSLYTAHRAHMRNLSAYYYLLVLTWGQGSA